MCVLYVHIYIYIYTYVCIIQKYIYILHINVFAYKHMHVCICIPYIIINSYIYINYSICCRPLRAGDVVDEGNEGSTTGTLIKVSAGASCQVKFLKSPLATQVSYHKITVTPTFQDL